MLSLVPGWSELQCLELTVKATPVASKTLTEKEEVRMAATSVQSPQQTQEEEEVVMAEPESSNNNSGSGSNNNNNVTNNNK